MDSKENAPTKNQVAKKTSKKLTSLEVHPSWAKFIQYCEELKYGELTRLQIQDGLPASAEYVRKKVRFI